MPNWAEGSLKIRGTRQDIKKFINEGLEAIDNAAYINSIAENSENCKRNEIEIIEDEYELEIKSPEGLYIKGTRRAFIEGDVYWYFEDKHKEVLVIDSFKQAWGVFAEEFVQLSKEYGLDFNIYVFEAGMQFNQAIEIVDGRIVKDEEIKFDDYDWECIFPTIGG